MSEVARAHNAFLLTNTNSPHYPFPEYRPRGFWTRHLQRIEANAGERTGANYSACDTFFWGHPLL